MEDTEIPYDSVIEVEQDTREAGSSVLLTPGNALIIQYSHIDAKKAFSKPVVLDKNIDELLDHKFVNAIKKNIKRNYHIITFNSNPEQLLNSLTVREQLGKYVV